MIGVGDVVRLTGDTSSLPLSDRSDLAGSVSDPWVVVLALGRFFHLVALLDGRPGDVCWIHVRRFDQLLQLRS